MFPLLTELPLSSAQIVAAVRLLLHVAHVDGARTEEEVRLVRQFYESCRPTSADLPDFDALLAERGAFTIAAGDFPETAHRVMLLALCVMVAYADGDYSAAERAAVAGAAGSLAVADDRLDAIVAQVKDYMLAQLSHLPDAASVAVVARELG
jgi:uncharacterized tellurite resistance protein B-like protein